MSGSHTITFTATRPISSTSRVLQKCKWDIISAKKLLRNDFMKVLLNYYNLEYLKKQLYYKFTNENILKLKLIVTIKVKGEDK